MSLRKQKSVAESFRELREIGSAWNAVKCVCRGLLKESPCPTNCKEFHDESLPNVMTLNEFETWVNSIPLPPPDNIKEAYESYIKRGKY